MVVGSNPTQSDSILVYAYGYRMTKQPSTESNPALLSEFTPAAKMFKNINEVINSFKDKPFLDASLRKRFRKINETLCKLIQEAPDHSFLLPAVLDYLNRINNEKFLIDPLNLATFEFWLNNFSELSDEENYHIRSKIAGKNIPRSEYQAYFPIGMNRTYSGTHFVAAHLSPDVDTMMASFWGWMDAFAARVSSGIHLWSLPGGPPDSPVTSIFSDMFGKAVFQIAARTAPTLTLTAMDLVSQKNVKKLLGNTLIGDIDHSPQTAIILVDEQGNYLGDWRDSDIEVVRQISILFKSCLRWFENNLHTKLISLFAKKDLSVNHFPSFNTSVFDVKIKDCEPALEFNEKQKKDLDLFFKKILGVQAGLNGTFADLNTALNKLSIGEMSAFQKLVENLPASDIFDKNGRLKEDRPLIFDHFEKIIKHLDQSIHSVRNYVERLDVVIGIKHDVLNMPPLYITLRSDVEDIKQKMQNNEYLTVIIQEQAGTLFPVGVVRDETLRTSALGTVSFRDFCNTEEVKMGSYLEVISVVDHHKSSLRTLSVPLAIIGDAQSSNILLAEQAFLINDKFSLGGMTPEQIENQINEVSGTLKNPSQIRIFQMLLKRRMAARLSDQFYIDPKREFDEYLTFLHAILDDTDLLTKVSYRDVICVASILNRLKSLSLGKEVEIIHFDDIPQDKNFAKKAAQKILQQNDLYSVYKKIYSFREAEVETNLELCIKGQHSNIFLDTKEQNGCTRIGQTKIFASNFPYFLKHADQIRHVWFEQSKKVHQEHPEIDLYIHMISTIASADEVYKNQIGNYPHLDELWIWIPATQQARDHLNGFLSGFQFAVKGIIDTLSLELMGPNTKDYARLFHAHFSQVPQTISSHAETGLPIAVLRFKAAALNSRKSMITPFLPRMIS